jgi:DNA ligase-4
VHMFHLIESSRENIEGNVDIYGDSYMRDVTPTELGKLCEEMLHPKTQDFDAGMFRLQLEERGRGIGELPGNIFGRYMIRFVPSENVDAEKNINLLLLKTQFSFAGGKIAESDGADGITHYVVVDEGNEDVVRGLRSKIAERRGPIPRIVRLKWLLDSWAEKTVLDEERYAV